MNINEKKIMATKNENKDVGVQKENRDKKQKALTSVIEKVHKKQDLDAEAGVDPQVDQLNEMPEPNVFPKEKKKDTGK